MIIIANKSWMSRAHIILYTLMSNTDIGVTIYRIMMVLAVDLVSSVEPNAIYIGAFMNSGRQHTNASDGGDVLYLRPPRMTPPYF